MRSSLLHKLLALALLGGLLLIPLVLIGSKIYERRATRNNVLAELAQTGVERQQLTGPVLVLPCQEHYVEENTDQTGKKRQEKRQRDCTQRFVPDALQMHATLTTETRYRGIYAARFYLTVLRVEGFFSVARQEQASRQESTREWGEPIVQVAIHDTRGIKNRVLLKWNELEFPFAPGFQEAMPGRAIHANLLKLGNQIQGQQRFAYTLELQGMDGIEFVPSAKQMEVHLQSSWPHPSFMGRHLPDKPTITAHGFEATWRISEFASNAPQTLVQCLDQSCSSMSGSTFGVNLIDPVDVYLQSSRAVTYGFLFVGLTFAIFFLFEILKALRIHPMQYGLVGAALAIFFLLLFSLSEHIPFLYAYLIAATACIVLLGFYVSYVLHSTKRGLFFSLFLVVLYAALYMLLQSEDYALLLGSILVFSVLAAIMVLTRNLQWYQVGQQLSTSVES